eukprot:COSAG02_NODE_1610_length_11681_cov_11.455103_3_plen_70_part_00
MLSLLPKCRYGPVLTVAIHIGQKLRRVVRAALCVRMVVAVAVLLLLLLLQQVAQWCGRLSRYERVLKQA